MNKLVLGWKTTLGSEPEYWLTHGAKPGKQTEDQEMSVPADTIDSHTIIIGQSGSGKSFFLGRLIEEILLRTRSRCIILDPNADFIKINEIQPKSLWTDAEYDTKARDGKLPHEKSRELFRIPWERVSKNLFTANNELLNSLEEKASDTFKSLKLWWPSISADALFEEDPLIQSQIYHCHSFSQAVGYLSALNDLVNVLEGIETPSDPLLVAEELFNDWMSKYTAKIEDFPRVIDAKFKITRLLQAIPKLRETDVSQLGLHHHSTSDNKVNAAIIDTWLITVKTALIYVNKEIGRYYFSRASEFKAKNILSNQPKILIDESIRLNIIDMPSISDVQTRNLFVNSILRREWERAKLAWQDALMKKGEEDVRVPTFIIIDEAHNFIPSEPGQKAQSTLREQFRTISAEGRKYGLFLILASQRPDKLDPIVLAECQNKAIMKLDSESILNISSKLLGLDAIPPRQLAKCLEFGKGLALLVGRWVSNNPILLFSAARRTVEGGRSLRPEYWANT